MDNLTHTLTGLMLSRSVVPRSVQRAGLLMMVGANAPDLDVFWSWIGGTANYLRLHRGITHSIAFSPVMALLAVAIVWLVERKKLPWLSLWLFSWIGVLSHLLLDWTNVYGIRMYLPFSSEWLRLDTVNVVDLVVWAILLLGVAAPALGRLVSSEIGAKSGRGTGWAVTVLFLLFVYEAGRYVMHDRAVETLNARIYEAGTPVRVAAFAQTANPFAWKGVVETSTSYVVFYMNLLEDFDPSSGRVFYKPQPSAFMEAARKTNEFDSLMGFSSFSLWRVNLLSDPAGSARVDLFDLRFGTPVSPGLAATAVVDAAGRVQSATVGFGSIQPK